MHSVISFAIKAVISTGLIWLILFRIDTSDLLSHLGRISPYDFILPTGIFLVSAAIVAVRWQLVMRSFGENRLYGPLVRVVFLSLLLNQALPSTIGGDSVRAYYLRKTGSTLGTALTCVLIDRIWALLCVVAMCLVSLPYLFFTYGSSNTMWMVILLVLLFACGIISVFFLRFIPGSVTSRFGFIHTFLNAIQKNTNAFLDFRQSILLFTISMIVQLLVSLTVFLLASSAGAPLSLLNSLILFQPVFLLSLIPISIGGWGVRESAAVLIFGLVGLSPVDSMTISVLLGVMMTIAGVLGGVIWVIGETLASIGWARQTFSSGAFSVKRTS